MNAAMPDYNVINDSDASGAQILEFTVNGKASRVSVMPDAMLLDVLRDQLKLTGTKKGCGEAECGTCTVLLDGRPVCSCMVPALSCGGRLVETIEGLAGPDGPHPIQVAFMDVGAVQCGYCTPGMVLTALALLRENSNHSRQQILEALAGNLCRCTGYEKIVEAVELAAARMQDLG